MADRILLIEDAPTASRAHLEQHGYTVQTAKAGDAVSKAHDLAPSLLVFIMSKRAERTADVARTLGWVHAVPMVFVDAAPGEVDAVPGAKRFVRSSEPLVRAVRTALASR